MGVIKHIDEWNTIGLLRGEQLKVTDRKLVQSDVFFFFDPGDRSYVSDVLVLGIL